MTDTTERDLDTLTDSIRALGSNAYGVTLRREMTRRRGKDISLGRLYTLLHELEDGGFIEGREVPGGPERGHRAKKMWALTQ